MNDLDVYTVVGMVWLFLPLILAILFLKLYARADLLIDRAKQDDLANRARLERQANFCCGLAYACFAVWPPLWLLMAIAILLIPIAWIWSRFREGIDAGLKRLRPKNV